LTTFSQKGSQNLELTQEKICKGRGLPTQVLTKDKSTMRRFIFGEKCPGGIEPPENNR
jgi:hypothetical protein